MSAHPVRRGRRTHRRWTLTLPILGAAYGTHFLRFPRRGWARSTESAGVGPVTQRTYWIDIAQPVHTDAQTVQHVLDALPELVPKVLAWFRRRPAATGPGPVGDRFTILMLGMRRARVQVVEVHGTSFRMQTLRQHSESGWIEVRTHPRPHGYRLEVVSRVRASSWFDRVAYLCGVGILQRMTWEATLRRALTYSGGRRVGHGTATVEWP
ncbi:hypothetical protein HNQ07_002154 [Deinococcus metalli]|uniref:DUF1990 family protein n=1 Tax=Deinococcus metalli TaxID=1141878 RepID=A0A7W8KEH3_9DEIO|nr:hypothetical protein [Deinococcus metalli]MBB5376690.1 hypothetical protein [Deinococcus metalli]GHF65863.1 hypothetical protein GCM10017781_46990 [Deinococcus metalli]